MEERRLFSRVDVMVRTDWKKVDRATQKVLSEGIAYSRNISEGGINITMERKDVGRENLLQLLFTLPGEHILKTPGRVVWINRHDPMKMSAFFDVGIRFLDIPALS